MISAFLVYVHEMAVSDECAVFIKLYCTFMVLFFFFKKSF